VNIGDLVQMKEKPRENEVRDIGIVLGFKPRNGVTSHRDPDCDVWNDAIVYWPGFGVAYNMRAMLEVISEGG
jgi:hypothetical protein